MSPRPKHQPQVKRNRDENSAPNIDRVEWHDGPLSLPYLWIIRGQLTAQRPVLALTECIARLHQRVNLARTLIDDRTFAVTQVTLHVILVAVAIRAVDLHRISGSGKAGIGGRLLSAEY